MMIAGGLGGVLIERVPLWTILLFDAATYLASFLIQATLLDHRLRLRIGGDVRGLPAALTRLRREIGDLEEPRRLLVRELLQASSTTR